MAKMETTAAKKKMCLKLFIIIGVLFNESILKKALGFLTEHYTGDIDGYVGENKLRIITSSNQQDFLVQHFSVGGNHSHRILTVRQISNVNTDRCRSYV